MYYEVGVFLGFLLVVNVISFYNRIVIDMKYIAVNDPKGEI